MKYLERNQQVVLNSKEAEWCYRFACYVKGANVEALTNVVLGSKNPHYKYLCARDIPQIQPDFDITPLEDSILELESTKWSNQFLYNVKGSRKELHQGVIQKNEAKSLAKRMARVVSGLKKSS